MCCIQGRVQGVCLAVMTGPFVPQVLSIKADDKISNAVTAGVLQRATAYIYLVTLHSTITKKQCYCIV